MKVLILGSKEFPIGTSDDSVPSGGMEVDIDKLAPELVKRGVEVHVITRRFKEAPNYEKRGKTSIYRVPWIRGIFFRNYSFNIMSFFKALEVIKKENIKVVQTVGVVASLVALILKLFTGIKVIAEPRGVQMRTWWFPINLILGIQELIAYPLADVVSVQSEEQKISLEKSLHIKLKNTVVIPTGIPHNRKLNPSKIKREFRLKKEKVITFVGRLHPVKGLEYFLQAAKLINDPRLKFILVGDGIQMSEIKKFVSENNLDSKIILTGWRDDVPDILAASDIYVLPSLSEGLPTSLLEAMAIGLPCIVTDIGLPVEHMKSALVIPTKSPEAIADAIKKLLTDSKLRKTLSKNGHKYLVAHHSMLASIKKYIEVYKKLAK
jgi:glycosyltransferase involved in cell wall biosynthesis